MTAPASGRRALATLYGVALLFVLMVVLAAAALSGEMRRRTLESAGGQAARHVAATQAALDRSLRRTHARTRVGLGMPVITPRR